MTINQIAQQLLTLFSPEERSIPDNGTYPGRNGAVMVAMNAALQQMYSNAYPWVDAVPRGAILNPPASVTIVVTNGSASAEITAPTWQDWMAGCTIVIDGSTFENQIINDVRNVVLRLPYDGPTGTISATVYQNMVKLGDDALSLTGVVRCDGQRMYPVPEPDVRSAFREFDYGVDRRYGANTSVTVRVSDHVGQPNGYAVETWNPSSTRGPVLRMKFAPACDMKRSLEFKVCRKPSVVVTDLSVSTTLPIPMEYVQSIFLPLAKFHLMGSAFFRAGDAVPVISSSYQTALTDLAKLTPKKNSGVRMRPIF